MSWFPHRASGFAILIAVACSTSALARDSTHEARLRRVNTIKQGLEKAYEHDPGRPSIAFRLARIEALFEHEEAALGWLRKLVSMSWDLGIDRVDFPRLQGNEEFEDIFETLRKRVPKLVRSKRAFVLPERDLMSENVAFDPSADRFFVGSINKRKIVVIDRDRRISDFVGPDDGMLSVLGMKVDSERRRLWVAANGDPMVPGTAAEDHGVSAVFEIDLEEGSVVRRFEREDRNPGHLFNDLCLDREGLIFVTDSGSSEIHQINPSDGTMNLLAIEPALQGINGIACGDDDLFVADLLGLVRVDLESLSATRMQSEPGITVGGIDGLYLHGRDLVGVQNAMGAGRVVRATLSVDSASIVGFEVLEVGHEAYDIPTTGVLVGDILYYIANSQLRSVDADGAMLPWEDLQETVVLALDLSRSGTGGGDSAYPHGRDLR